MAAANPAYLSGLAAALGNLGACYRGLGRPDHALAPAAEAVTLYRELAAANPAHQAGLARALTNLGARGPPAQRCRFRSWAWTVTFILNSLGPGHRLGIATGAADALTSFLLSVWVAGYRTWVVRPVENSVTERRLWRSDP